jgi:hypothetical protein
MQPEINKISKDIREEQISFDADIDRGK